MSQEPLFTEIYRKNVAAQNDGAHFVRACAVEMHFNMPQEPLYTEIYKKNARSRPVKTRSKPIQNPFETR
jgi:hypothetical protein